MRRFTTLRVWQAAAVALTAALLSGCEAGPVTTVHVTGPSQAQINVAAVFTGEAADAVLSDQAILDDLVANVERLTGHEVQVSREADTLMASSVVTAEELPKLSSITGVGSVSATTQGSDTTVLVEMVPATHLAEAVAEGTKGREDSEALAATLLASATVRVVVSFEGEVLSSSAQGVELESTETTVTASRPADASDPASFQVTGRTFGKSWLPWILGGAVLLLAVIGWLVAQRRNAPGVGA